MFVPRDLENRVYKATQGRVQGASTNLNTAYPQFLNSTNVYRNLQTRGKAAFLPQEHPARRKPATGFPTTNFRQSKHTIITREHITYKRGVP